MLKKQESYATTGILMITILSSLSLIYQLLAKKEIKFSNDRRSVWLGQHHLIEKLKKIRRSSEEAKKIQDSRHTRSQYGAQFRPLRCSGQEIIKGFQIRC